MTVTAADIQALPSGEFSAVATATLERYIARAQSRLSSASLGNQYDEAVTYLTAHLYSLAAAGSGGASGPVSSESAGSMSRSYAIDPRAMSGYGATSWGRMLAQLIHENCAGGAVA